MRRFPAVVVTWSLCAGLTSAAQEQPPVFRTGVDLIPVDVTVTDRNGRQVTDLAAEEFEVQVDGRPRRVVSAEYVRLVDAPGQQAPVAPPPTPYYSTNVAAAGRGRLILLLVDQGNIRAGAARPVMTSALRFLDRLSPADRVAAVAIPGPGVLVDFTTEHDKVREGLLRISGLYTPYRKRFNISLTEALAVVQNRDPRLLLALMLRECGAISGTLEAERCEREVEQEAGELLFHEREITASSLRGMREVFRSLRQSDAPKSVILISEGLALDGLGGEVDDIAALAADARASLDVLLLDVPHFDATQAQMPPTAREDRNLRELGLDMLAGLARGGLYRIATTADYAFDRIHQAMAGYYLLGLESTPADRDGRRRQIRVRTSRRDVTVYSRRGFLAPGGAAALSPEAAVIRALQSPMGASDLPLRLSTWTYKESGSARVRMLLAVEIERTTGEPLEYVTGLAVLDTATGRALTSTVEPRTLAEDAADAGLAVHSGALTLEPGTYRLRFAAANHEGRVGSVEREVHAWHMDEGELAFGDLLLSPVPDDERTSLVPHVEPRVQAGALIAVTEIYGTSDDRLDALDARLEVVRDEDGAPLTISPMQLAFGDSREVRTAQAGIDTGLLPPGRYLARVVVTEADRPRGDLVRPFRVMPRSLGATRSDGSEPMLVLPPPAFDRGELLDAGVLEPVLQLVADGRPTDVQTAVAEARSGAYGAGAMAAFRAGDQMVAAFLRGLELFADARFPQAAVQFQSAMSMAPSFAPARLFLGACFAAGDRHREAASLLTSAASAALPVPHIGRLAGEAWLRAGEASQAIAPLTQALGYADDLRVKRALGLAYVLAGQPAEGVPLLAAYLDAVPEDESALLAGLYGVYAQHAVAPRHERLAGDLTRAKAWARTYARLDGVMSPLATVWVEYLDSLR